MKKYERLHSYFAGRSESHVVLSFDELEKILGDTLPPSAHQYPAWWGNSTTAAHPYSRAWTENGYYTTQVRSTLSSQKIEFHKR